MTTNVNKNSENLEENIFWLFWAFDNRFEERIEVESILDLNWGFRCICTLQQHLNKSNATQKYNSINPDIYGIITLQEPYIDFLGNTCANPR